MCKVCKMTLWFWLLSTLKRKPIKIYIYILMPTDSFVVPFSRVGASISKATNADVSVSISLYLFALCSHLKIWSIHFAIESLPLFMVISQDVDINWVNVKKSPLSLLFFFPSECNAAIHKKCIDKIIGRCTGTAANSRDTVVRITFLCCCTATCELPLCASNTSIF